MKWDGKKLKARLVRNGKLKLLSVAFACGLWLLVNAGERDAEMTLLMPLELRNLPAQFVVAGSQTEFIDLRLRGPRTLLGQLKSKKVKLDLTGVRPGLSSFRITANLLNLPRGVKIVRISPAQINLDIAQVLKRTVPVRLKLVGEPPHGYRVTDTQVVPDRIEVTGPAPQVEKLEAVSTDTVDVGRLTQSVTRDLALRGPEGALVTYSTERVRVQVNIQEVMITREFRRRKIEIKNAAFRAVVSPFQADVTVHGPQRLVEELRLSDGEVFVDASGQEPGTVTVPVTVLLPPGVELVSQEPTEVELRLVDDSKKKPQNLKATEKKNKPGV